MRERGIKPLGENVHSDRLAVEGANFVAQLTTVRRHNGKTLHPLAPSGLSQYMSAIRYHFKTTGRPDPFRGSLLKYQSDQPTLASLAVKGWARNWEKEKQQAAPVTPGMINILWRDAKAAHNPEQHTAAAVNTIAFLALLRGGNLVPRGHMPFDPDRQMRQRDLTFHTTHATLTVRVEKNDQRKSKPRLIHLFRTNEGACPYAILARQLARNPDKNPDAPLFQQQDGSPFRREQATNALRRAAAAAGLNPMKYSMHSPRVGAVNALLIQGYSFEYIKVAGNWRSNAVFEYVRQQMQTTKPTEHLPGRPSKAQRDMLKPIAARRLKALQMIDN
jgi:hypothetical protein